MYHAAGTDGPNSINLTRVMDRLKLQEAWLNCWVPQRHVVTTSPLINPGTQCNGCIADCELKRHTRVADAPNNGNYMNVMDRLKLQYGYLNHWVRQCRMGVTGSDFQSATV